MFPAETATYMFIVCFDWGYLWDENKCPIMLLEAIGYELDRAI